MVKVLSSIVLAMQIAAPNNSKPAPPQMFREVRYIRGDRVWKCGSGCWGTLVLEPDGLRLSGQKFPPADRVPIDGIFTIPFSEITDITTSASREEVNQGAATALGFKVLTNNFEYIEIHTETSTNAGVLVFAVPPHSAEDTVAKIKFAMKRAASR